DPTRVGCRDTRRVTAQVSRHRRSASRKAASDGASTRPHRPPLNDDLVAYVTRRLTDRDRRILDLLYEHRVFTTDQLSEAFFGSLMGEARRVAGCRLVEWWSERRCEAWCRDLVRPDGYGAWRDDSRLVEFFLEYDRGTEPLDRIHEKLEGYGWLADAIERHI